MDDNFTMHFKGKHLYSQEQTTHHTHPGAAPGFSSRLALPACALETVVPAVQYDCHISIGLLLFFYSRFIFKARKLS